MKRHWDQLGRERDCECMETPNCSRFASGLGLAIISIIVPQQQI